MLSSKRDNKSAVIAPRVESPRASQPKREKLYSPPHVADLALAALVNRNAENRVTSDISSKLPDVKNKDDFKALLSVLTDEKDDDTVRNEVANLLERSKCPDMASALMRVLDNPQEKPRFRSFAMQHLGGLIPVNNDDRRERILNKIRQSLNDRHVEVRREALLALMRQRDALGIETAVKWLGGKARGQEDVRDLAVRCVSELNLREHIAAIRSLARDPNDVVRIAALVALSEWYDDESRPAFEEAAKAPTERLQRAGKAALARLDSLERLLPRDQQTVENLIPMLRHKQVQIHNQAAIALSRFGMNPKLAIPALSEALLQLDATCTTAQIVVYLDLLRKMGTASSSASDSIIQLMNERAAIYQNRNKAEVHRLRAYMLLTLADIGKARDAILYIAESLANSDKDMVYNYAIAAYASNNLGADAKAFTPLLTRALKSDFKDRALTLQSYHAPLTPSTTTSARIESIRALAKIGPDAAEAIPLLEELAKSEPNSKDNLPSWKTEAQRALAAIKKVNSQK